MDNQNIKSQQNNTIKYIDVLLQDWKLIAFITGAIGLVTLVYLLFFSNPVYKAQLTILPTGEEAGTFSALSVMANELGVDIPGTKVKINTPQIYQRIIASQRMTDSLAQKAYQGRKENGPRTLAQVLGIKEKNPELMRYFLHEAVMGMIKMPISIKEGTLDIMVTFKDPDIASQMANYIVEQLDTYNKYFRKSKAGNNRKYIEEQLSKAREDLRRAEQNLTFFRENNRQLMSSPSLQQEMVRRTRDLRIQEEIFVIITKEYEKAKLQEIKDIPIIDIVEKARPPAVKSNSRTRVLLASIAFGLFLGIAFIIGREYLKESTIISDIQATQGYQIFAGDIKKIVNKIFPKFRI
ncbi:MAG: hypothetical protein A2509_04000 [Candidatus Edwardsbacteria bacterium RIFOXYD12_FULL_50_11]|uniref:Polysaccharide chain length determinant N-terminal domain-containing protein n=1 Tax=Candidatus Edwardsbacteria bacterium GWF2_54_11 TaxID=1817851 RepID=A0A1F5R105_9BACT|nr:MAG: hypothetical protein A2502_05205 [Candidatus Edwardsbacteria bacterium RifOxyC12_full_54_24]OGF07854.1 MAG: hypothetical protein A2273_05160 [Candidatus Edwardsbacteria bacterium RifOxyA12_full_54_48]OGF08126.1 MAG: hypothetical protein A2024_08070 [Candidatus Edwardsbacteria bacterium GWF2_54_11]OGF10103.1 MAG: hypothetical protein A3K15_11575 [Candidatus Edwardsbacteria bacterium GWE2_54_12]OGF15014.1 MAG: hypothetical protein A2509_04000 [Candidatus Edwardsbacteria bacterium RIFOXYD1